MITSGTGLSSGRVVARVVLDHAGDADPVLAEDLGERGEHARPVGDREPEVIAAPDLARRASGGAAGPTRTRGSSARNVSAARPTTTSIRSPTTAEAVGIMPGPSAVEERVAHGVADDPDRVVGPADLGQRRPLLDQRRRHPQLQARLRELGQGQQLDRVAELGRVADVGELEPVDPRPGDLAGRARWRRRRAGRGSPACARCRCRRRRASGRPRRSRAPGPGAGPSS